jgi:hypothetical protein
MIAHKYRKKFVVAPDGDFVLVDRQIDPRVYFAPDGDSPVATTKQTLSKQVDHRAIAAALLDCDPSAIVAIYADSKGRVLGTTITQTRNGHTPAAFRAAFRSLPREAKQVTFAAVSPINSATRTAINESSDHYLIRCLDFLTITPS